MDKTELIGRVEYKIDNYWAKMWALKRVGNVDIQSIRMVIRAPHLVTMLCDEDLAFLHRACGDDQDLLDYFLFER